MRHSNFKARKEVLRITELEVMLMAAYLYAYAVKKTNLTFRHIVYQRFDNVYPQNN